MNRCSPVPPADCGHICYGCCFLVPWENTEAFISVACFVGCLMPRVIDAIKGRKTGENMNPPSASASNDDDQ